MLALLHNKTAQSVSGWISIFTFIIGILAKMTPEWFGNLSWPQAALAGIAGSLIGSLLLAFVLLIGAFAFRIFKPASAPHLVDDRVLKEDISGFTNQAVASDDGALAARVVELEKIKTAIIDDYQRMLGMEALFNEALEKSTKSIAPLIDLPDKLEAVRVDGAIAAHNVERLEQSQKQYQERTKSAFYAIGATGALAQLEASLEEDASDLYDPFKRGEAYNTEKWLQWENVHSRWTSTLTQWLGTAQWYAIAVAERTNTVDEALYGADWTLSEQQFPNAEAVRRFKKHRIIRSNWLAVLPDVKRGVHAVAFSGMSESDVRSGRPVG